MRPLSPLLAAAALTLSPLAGASGRQAPPAGSNTEAARRFDEVLAAHRKVIALLADDAALDEVTRPRAVMAGWILSQRGHDAAGALSEALASDAARALGAGQPPPLSTSFLERLEAAPDLRDGDKLAFADVLADLAEAVAAAPAGPEQRRLAARIDEDARAIGGIRARYDQEMIKIFGKLRTRGMTIRREAWDAYAGFVRGLHPPQATVRELDAEVTAALGGVRGAGRRKADETLVDGTTLPPKTLVLTFDDGPHPRHTDRIRAILEKYGVKALFFEVGRNVGAVKGAEVKERPAAAATRRLQAAGHMIGNHTYSHPVLPRQTLDQVKEELDEADVALGTALSAKPALFRPPYGAFDDKVRAALAARGQKAFLWNVDSLDWSDPVPTSIAQRVLEQVEKEGRGVVLMHDIHAQSVAALPLVLETLQKRGYRFVLWDGGAPPAAAPSASDPAPAPYRESFAVVVGINRYRKWPRLGYAVNDAKAVRDLLVERYAFRPENVTVLLDGEATRERILSVLGDVLANPKKVGREDRVLFFFAGHGATRTLPSGKSLGYIIPVEADTTSYQSQAISMTNFQDVSEAIPAKHLFFVMDACYSGLALVRGGPTTAGATNFLKEITRRTARQMLTAGGADEQVADSGPGGHSIFTWTLLQGLDGRADLNGDGVITASELAAYVAPAVSQLSRQTPAFGSLVGSEGGEFVFSLGHDAELLSDVSAQLDQKAIALNAELERVRKEISEKQSKNEQLERELAAAKVRLARVDAAGARSAPADDARRRSDQGMRLYREKRYREALAEFEAAAKLVPDDVQVVNNVGFVHYKLGEYRASLQWLQKAVALDPNRGVAYLNLGDTLAELGRRKEAVSAWERYLALVPGSPLAAKVREKIAAAR